MPWLVERRVAQVDTDSYEVPSPTRVLPWVRPNDADVSTYASFDLTYRYEEQSELLIAYTCE